MLVPPQVILRQPLGSTVCVQASPVGPWSTRARTNGRVTNAAGSSLEQFLPGMQVGCGPAAATVGGNAGQGLIEPGFGLHFGCGKAAAVSWTPPGQFGSHGGRGNGPAATSGGLGNGSCGAAHRMKWQGAGGSGGAGGRPTVASEPPGHGGRGPPQVGVGTPGTWAMIWPGGNGRGSGRWPTTVWVWGTDSADALVGVKASIAISNAKTQQLRVFFTCTPFNRQPEGAAERILPYAGVCYF